MRLAFNRHLWLIASIQTKVIDMMTTKASEKRKYVSPISTASLPKETERSILLGEIAGSQSKAFFDLDMLTKHIFIVGSSGTGKTIAGMVIAEECLLKNVAVMVFDPTNKWTIFDKCNKIQVSSDKLNLNMEDYIERGKMSVFVLDHLSENDYNEFMRNCLESLANKSWSTTDKLELLLVFENAYKLSPNFGNKAALMLEKGCREFRKYGIGIMLITHSFSDFGPPVLGNVSSEIWFKTSYDNDLERITRRYGHKYIMALTRLRVGEAMVANVDYNYSKPWFVKFKPLYKKF